MSEDLVERVARAIEAELFKIEELGTGRGIITPECLARAALAAMPGWQPIETAPKDGRELFLFGICRPSDDSARGYAPDANVGWWETDHWMVRTPGEVCDAELWMSIPPRSRPKDHSPTKET